MEGDDEAELVGDAAGADGTFFFFGLFFLPSPFPIMSQVDDDERQVDVVDDSIWTGDPYIEHELEDRIGENNAWVAGSKPMKPRSNRTALMDLKCMGGLLV